MTPPSHHGPTHVPQATGLPDGTAGHLVPEPGGGEGTMPKGTTDPTVEAGEGVRYA
ncbi:hypothetical protein [Lichenifustis flavocetrariae]|uniref:Uncharacterized protein n=1 Tax=Lichenifustis flavocetrariae TaxID=2949735 RepID=A0AA41YZM9_9HYPH|nr:hypothetical protein [Lichenifustis flavocetrariae]MCW6511511.1 hypothetical protein [Lichenifustis flavocetrariae]